MPTTAAIRVPATTANLGPGYDCLGIALQLYNTVTVTSSAESPAVDSMAGAAATAFFSAAQREPFGFSWKAEGDVPRSRGLGSSVTVRLGLLMGLNEIAERPLDRDQLFALCATLEGHPDNAAPAAFGGFTVAGDRQTARFSVAAELSFVLLIPNFEVRTPDARRVLPAEINRLSAVASCANACRITAAFAGGDYELLRGAFDDGLHQPFRKPLVPFLDQVIAAGVEAGALGGFLSGSGSTICCVTLGDAEAVAAAMKSAAGEGSRTVITIADNNGAQLLA